jgi:hypothetical protein
MTHDDLTDFFAGLATIGLMMRGVGGVREERKIAKQAYDMADALVEERKRRDLEERTSC